MKKIRPEGIYIPMVTPFKDDASRITVLKGFSEDLLPALMVGAQGGISSAYNIVPDLMVDLYLGYGSESKYN